MKRVTNFSASDGIRAVKVRLEYEADARGQALIEKNHDNEEIEDAIFKALNKTFWAATIKVRP